MDLEQWLRHRLAGAVEAGDVPAELFAELNANLAAADSLPAEGRLAKLLDVPGREIPEAVRLLNGLPAEAREFAFRVAVEAWLAWQRDAYADRGREDQPPTEE